MSHRLIKAYKAFTAKDWPGSSRSGPARGPAAAPGASVLAGLADSNLTILIRALLDAQGAEGLESPAAGNGPAGVAALLPAGPGGMPPEADHLSAGPEAFSLIRERLEAVHEDGAAKFVEFRDRWRKRLAYVQLQPFLQRNQWFVQASEGWTLAGKGTRKDAKMLYLQSLHDMASDGERQVSFISGHIFRQEAEVASLWHKESVRDNRSKLLPALEATLRNGESAVFKRLRLSLGDLAAETFTERVNKWDKRAFASEEELFRQAAWPWLGHGRESGFQGFMEAFADLCEALCGAMLNHYEGKWDLYLRGLALKSERASHARETAPRDNLNRG